MSPTIAVRGFASREVEPELVQLTISVAARGKDREGTLARLADRVSALKVLLDRYADGIDSRETSGLYVHPETKGRGERVSAYSGSVTTTVTFTDFAGLGDVVMALADADQTTVAGPYWSVRPDSPAYRDVRLAAVRDAIARSREYAEALSAEVLGLVELSDEPDHGGPGMYRALRMDASDSQLELDPQRQTVTATVAAKFTISDPPLG
jgi:uncharacterized protein YggE